MDLAEEYLVTPSSIHDKPRLPLYLILEKETKQTQLVLPYQLNTTVPSIINQPSQTTYTPSETLNLIYFEDTELRPAIISTTVETSQELTLTSNPHGPSFELTLKVEGNDSTLGLELATNTDNSCITLKSCRPFTPVA